MMKPTLKSVAENVLSLSIRVDALAASVDARFEQVDARFEQVDKRFEQVDRRFDALEDRIGAEVEGFRRYVDERMQAGVAEMRRFFEIVAEQMKAERTLVLDRSLAAGEDVARLRAANVAEHVGFEKTLADHETRLKRLESQ